MRQRAAGDVQRVRERQRVGIAGARQGAERGLVHQRAERKVCEEKPPHFLPHEVRRFAAEDAARAAEMRLEFIKCRFDFPALVIE